MCLQRFSGTYLKKTFPHPEEKLLLDLGCGKRKRPGHIGLDIAKIQGVDIVFNLDAGIPIEDDVIDGVFSNFFFEHASNIVFLFQEIFRVSKNGATIEFRVPYFQSLSQFQDPTHQVAIMPEMIRYFSGEDWYGSDYDFNVTFKLKEVIYHYYPPFDVFHAKKLFFLWPVSIPFLLFARRFFWNVVHSISMKLEVIK